MKKKSLVCWMYKGWGIKKDNLSFGFPTVFLNNMGIAKRKEDNYHNTKVKITIEEIK